MTVAVSHRRNRSVEAVVGDSGSLSKLVLVTVAVSHRRNRSVEAGVGGSLSKLVLVTVAVCRSWCW